MPRAVRRLVLLCCGPQGGFSLLDDDALLPPGLEGRLGVEVRVVVTGRSSRQVDLHDVERAARDQLRALRLIDYVVGRRRHGVERSDRPQVVAQGSQWLDLRHGGGRLPRRPRAASLSAHYFDG